LVGASVGDAVGDSVGNGVGASVRVPPPHAQQTSLAVPFP
jgi:hypothetical protein